LFAQGTRVSSTNKTDQHDITEILLKVALNTISQTKELNIDFVWTQHGKPNTQNEKKPFKYLKQK